MTRIILLKLHQNVILKFSPYTRTKQWMKTDQMKFGKQAAKPTQCAQLLFQTPQKLNNK